MYIRQFDSIFFHFLLKCLLYIVHQEWTSFPQLSTVLAAELWEEAPKPLQQNQPGSTTASSLLPKDFWTRNNNSLLHPFYVLCNIFNYSIYVCTFSYSFFVGTCCFYPALFWAIETKFCSHSTIKRKSNYHKRKSKSLHSTTALYETLYDGLMLKINAAALL